MIQTRPGNYTRLNKLTTIPVNFCIDLLLRSYSDLRATYILWSLITDELSQYLPLPGFFVWANSWQKCPKLTRFLLS